MGNNGQRGVRSHTQEREWLLGLGDGNIIAGVQHLIEQAEGVNRDFSPFILSTFPSKKSSQNHLSSLLSRKTKN